MNIKNFNKVILIVLFSGLLFYAGKVLRDNYQGMKEDYNNLCVLYYKNIVIKSTISFNNDLNREKVILRVFESNCNGCKQKLYQEMKDLIGFDNFDVITDYNIGITEDYKNCIERPVFIPELDRLMKSYLLYFNPTLGKYVYFYTEKDFDVLNRKVIIFIKEAIEL